MRSEPLNGGAPAPGLAASAEAPFLRLPDAGSVFRERARRLRALSAQGGGIAAYLGFIAQLADAQHQASERYSALGADEGTPLLSSRGLPEPPLPAIAEALPGAWREALDSLLGGLRSQDDRIGELIGTLRGAPPETRDVWARSLLAGDFQQLDPGLTALINAALQVCWTARASRLEAAECGRTANENLCPICGSLPVASLMTTGGSIQGLRYLCCSLCSTQWHLPRIRCVHCDSTKGVSYYRIEGAGDSVRAEACDECKTYLKILDREKDSELDPFADDLASLALDLMMAEAGYARFGANPFLMPGG